MKELKNQIETQIVGFKYLSIILRKLVRLNNLGKLSVKIIKIYSNKYCPVNKPK